MNIQKLLFSPRAIMTLALAAALVFPFLAEADSSSEIAMQNKRENPLPVQADISQINQEERAALLAQLKLYKKELEVIKAQLAELEATPSTTALPVTSPASNLAPSATPLKPDNSQEINPKPPNPVKPAMVKQDDFDLPDGLFIALGLLLLILAIWMGLRLYSKIKTRASFKSQDVKHVVKATSVDQSKKFVSSASSKATLQASTSHAPPSPAKTTPAPAAVTTPSPVKGDAALNDFSPPEINQAENETQVNSMLEEAELYASHGRSAKSVEILEEIIKLRPTKATAWPLLLSIYSSLGKAAEFEKTARKFLKYHQDSDYWSKIQALGRTLDKYNPLYADRSNVTPVASLPDAAIPVQQVGDILMEMGILSKQDLLKHLDDFDPKKHGRFGGYLVSRKIITHAQLDQALLQQQGIVTEDNTNALPLLNDLENFLAGFDPKRDGSVSEFLASRNAATAEQLNQLFQPQPSQGAKNETHQADALPPFGKESN